MSIQLMIDVWKSDLDRNCKAVALVYADAASDDGNGIYFSIEYAAWKSGYDHRSITRILRKLEDLGVLLFLGRSESQTKRYRFMVDNLPQRPSWKEYREQKTQGGDKMSSLGVTKCPPAPDKMSPNPTYYPTYPNLLISTGFENLNPDTPPESVSPLSVSEFDVVNQTSNSVMSTAYVDPVAEDPALVFAHQFPDVEQDIAVLLPPVATYPVKVKVKPAKAAAKPKAVKPPKVPRELNAKELEFLAKIEQLNPLIAPDVKQRLSEYSRSLPWSVAQVFLLTGYMPRPNNWHAIVSLNGVAFDEKRMVDCYNEWTERGYNERGLAWLLEWYKAGGPPQYTPKYAAPDAYVPPPKPQALEWEDSPIGKEAMARMAKQKAEKEQEMKGQV